jgi:FixJ family two-component response regulator
MPGPEKKKKSIVIVEDDASVSQALVRLLRAAGLEPVAFGSAEDMLSANPAAPVACLVIDVQLPGMSGFALRDRLAGAGAIPPVIFITAFDEPETRAHAQRAGAAFLAKPFTGTVLLEAIERSTLAA